MWAELLPTRRPASVNLGSCDGQLLRRSRPVRLPARSPEFRGFGRPPQLLPRSAEGSPGHDDPGGRWRRSFTPVRCGRSPNRHSPQKPPTSPLTAPDLRQASRLSGKTSGCAPLLSIRVRVGSREVRIMETSTVSEVHEGEDHRPVGPSAVRARWAVVGFLAIAAFFLFSEHRAHLFGVLPWLFLLACPFLHLFMHGRHGSGHGGRADESARRPNSGRGGKP